MGQLFDFAVLASEQGVSKPDPRIFHNTAEMAGCGADELLHVGDSLVDDSIGVSDGGARAVWINRIGIAASPENMLEQAIELTGENPKTKAVTKAMKAYVPQPHIEHLLSREGKFDLNLDDWYEFRHMEHDDWPK